jgi:arylsulfatase
VERPPIVLITLDELLRESLGCYGGRAAQTPNIDRLAGESIRFTRAHTVSPWCLPSRCSILTGLLPHNSGAYSNFRKCALDAGVPNLYTELRALGYSAAHVGKCHYAPVPYGDTRPDVTLPYDEFKAYYVRLGIDHLDLQDDKQVSVWFYDDYSRELDAAGHLEAYRDATWARLENGRVFPFPAPAEWHPDSWVGRKAVEYVEGYRGERSPFLWVSFSGPHYPIDPPSEYLDRVDVSLDVPRSVRAGELDDTTRIHHKSWRGPGGIDGCAGAEGGACARYDDAYWKRHRHHYFANVSQIDEWVGRILATVERRWGDALVILLADHGEMLGNHGLWGKHNCAYEEVWGIPLIVRYPGSRGGSNCGSLVSNADIMATCLHAAGRPERAWGDGLDYRTLADSGGYKHVFAEGEGYLAATDGTIKLVRIQQPERRGAPELSVFDELYDRAEDPHEHENRIHDPRYASRVASLRGEVAAMLMRKALP